MDEWKPVEVEEIPRRGRFREEVRDTIANFLKLVEKKGTNAICREFSERELAMKYYDSFKDEVSKKNLPIEVRIRKQNPTNYKLFLIKTELES